MESMMHKIKTTKSLLYAGLLLAVLAGFAPQIVVSDQSAITIIQVTPSQAMQGDQNLRVTIKGKGFSSNSRVRFLVTGTNDDSHIQVPVTIYDQSSGTDGDDEDGLIAFINVSDTASIGGYDLEISDTDGRGGKGTDLFLVFRKPVDEDAPALIEGLQTRMRDSISMQLKWTAPADDGVDVRSGPVDHYVIRQAKQGATCAQPYDWSEAIDLDLTRKLNPGKQKAPAQPLTNEIQTIIDLEPDTCYAFAVEPYDEVGNTPGPAMVTGTTTATSEGWTTPELVFIGPGNGLHKELAYDPLDLEPAFLLETPGGGKARYAKRDSATEEWGTKAVIKSSGYNAVDLLFDNVTGNPVGLLTDQNGNLSLVEKIRDRWQATPISPAASYWSNRSLAQDSFGQLTVAFDGDNAMLLATSNEGSFTVETARPETRAVRKLGDPKDTWLHFTQRLGHRPEILTHPLREQPVLVYQHPWPSYPEFDFTEYGLSFLGFDEIDSLNSKFWSDVVGEYEILTHYSALDPDGELTFVIEHNPADKPSKSKISMLRWAHPKPWSIWQPTDIDPDDPGPQHLYSTAYRSDGTLFVAWQSKATVKVGRFCESGLGFACESHWKELDTWVTETAFVLSSKRTTSGVMTLDPSGPNGGTPTIGVTTASGLVFTRCIPETSRICTAEGEP
jgi:hypothetical protein